MEAEGDEEAGCRFEPSDLLLPLEKTALKKHTETKEKQKKKSTKEMKRITKSNEQRTKSIRIITQTKNQ